MAYYSMTRHVYTWTAKGDEFNELMKFLLAKSYWFHYEYSAGLHQITCGVSPERYKELKKGDIYDFD